MADILQSGLDWLSAKRNAFMAQAIVYQVGSELIAMTGTRGPLQTQMESVEAVDTVADAQDWIISVSQFVLANGQAFEPERGHVIKFTFRGETQVFDVLPIAGEREFRKVNADNDFRIHTKQGRSE